MAEVIGLIFPLLAFLGAFVLIGFIAWIISRTRREKTARMIELQSRMLEKFASSQEFVGFLQTPEGQRYLKGFAEEPRAHPKERILKSVRTGVVLVVFGIGLIVIAFLIGFERPTEEPPFVIGFLALFLGAGFLASAAVSYYMSKAWGLFPEEPKRIPTKQS